jgi:regulator of cell morphogenesis and NO signaling
MIRFNTQSSVGRFVADCGRRAKVFQELGIDPVWFRHGLRPLDEVCREKGLDPEQVLGRLLACCNAPAGCGEDWSRATLSELAEHIVEVHHGRLRRDLPRLQRLAETVAEAHGKARPELIRVRDLLADFAAATGRHMNEEERMLLPVVRLLEGAERCRECGLAGAPFGDWAIEAMERDHRGCDAIFERLKQAAGDFRPPQDACTAHRRLLEGLAALEKDLAQHDAEEHDVLFRLARMLGADTTPSQTHEPVRRQEAAR